MEKNNLKYGSIYHTDEEIEEIKNEFLESFWTTKITRYKTNRNGKSFDYLLVCTNEIFYRTLQGWLSDANRERPNYKQKLHYEDWMAEAALSVQATMRMFKPTQKDFDWKALLKDETEEEAEKNVSKKILFKYLNRGAQRDLDKYQRFVDQVEFSKQEKTVQGKVVQRDYYYNSLNLTSYDQSNNDDDEYSILNLFGEEAGLYFTSDNHVANHFLKWFKENRENILSKNQIELLNNLELANDEFCDVDLNTEEYTGKSASNVNDTKKRILIAIEEAWTKQNPLGRKTRQQLRKEAEIDFWNELLTLAKLPDEEIENQNLLISKWIVDKMTDGKGNNMNGKEGDIFLLDLVYDNLGASEHIFNITTAIKKNEQISSKTLYKIIELVEERMNKLEMYDANSIEPAYRVETEEFLNKDKPKEKLKPLPKNGKVVTNHHKMRTLPDLSQTEYMSEEERQKLLDAEADQYAAEQSQVEYDEKNSIFFRRKI